MLDLMIMSDLTRDKKIALMREAIGFFFVNIEDFSFFDFDSISGVFEELTVDTLRLNLSRLQVCEEYEYWDIDTLCGGVVRFYDVLISVCSKNMAK